MKKRIIAGILILALFVLFVSFSSYTMEFKGVMIAEEQKTEVDITLRNRRINKILNKISGDLSVQLKTGEILEYHSQGPTYGLGVRGKEYYAVIFYRFSDGGGYEYGYMYFDKGFKNIVFPADDMDKERTIYAADDEFAEKIFKKQEKRKNRLGGANGRE